MRIEHLLPVVAYLLGSLPFSFLVVKLVRGIDVRTVGSGNAGATNVLRSSGRVPALVALLLDVLKGAAAVALAQLLQADAVTIGLCASAAVLGHVFPLFLGFRGGKGVATAAGALALLSPWVCAAVLVVFVATVAVTRFVSLASILAAAAFPIGLWIAGRVSEAPSGGDPWILLSSAFIAGLIAVKHRENIARLMQGKEHKLGESARQPEESE